MKKMVLTLFLAGCGDLRDDSVESCTIDSAGYEFTEFHCGTKDPVRRIVCPRPVTHGQVVSHGGRPRCTSASLVEEYSLGHCDSYNICNESGI